MMGPGWIVSNERATLTAMGWGLLAGCVARFGGTTVSPVLVFPSPFQSLSSPPPTLSLPLSTSTQTVTFPSLSLSLSLSHSVLF